MGGDETSSTVPQLEDFGISPQYGFLPVEAPLLRLPQPVYAPWEDVVARIPKLLRSGKVKAEIDDLPILPTVHLKSEAEWRRAYSVLAFLCNGYVWCDPNPNDHLPPCVSRPLLEACSHLGVPPVVSFASVCLWNYRSTSDTCSLGLDDLSAISTFTESKDEHWFYMVSVAIEAKGGSMIPRLLQAIVAARNDEKSVVTDRLREFAEVLEELGPLLERMYEHCRPDFFYNKLRPYLAGTKNMAEVGLPNGLCYVVGDSECWWLRHAGGSNAQSSLLQLFDVVLGVEHRPTGVKRNKVVKSELEESINGGPKSRHTFLEEMRAYMPVNHARFLEAVESVANIREYVEHHQEDAALKDAYNKCVAMLQELRHKHIRMVTRYIVVQSHRSPAGNNEGKGQESGDADATTSRPKGLAKFRHCSDIRDTKDSNKKQRGTGGTALVPFLKQTRNETAELRLDMRSEKERHGWTQSLVELSTARA